MGAEGRGLPHQVLGGAEPLEAVQGEQVSRILVQELGGLFEPALLAQVCSVPKLCLLSPHTGVSPQSHGLLPAAHGPVGLDELMSGVGASEGHFPQDSLPPVSL